MQATDMSISQAINQQIRIDCLLCTKTDQEEQVESVAQPPRSFMWVQCDE